MSCFFSCLTLAACSREFPANVGFNRVRVKGAVVVPVLPGTVAAVAEDGGDFRLEVALEEDVAVLDGPSRTTFSLEHACQFLEVIPRSDEALHESYGLADALPGVECHA